MIASLRVDARRRVLRLLDQPRHVLEEEIMHILLVHVLQLEAARGVALGHGVTGVAIHDVFVVVVGVVAPVAVFHVWMLG